MGIVDIARRMNDIEQAFDNDQTGCAEDALFPEYERLMMNLTSMCVEMLERCN